MKALRLSEAELLAIEKRIKRGTTVRENRIEGGRDVKAEGKYGNKKTERDGIVFHSKKEADRYGQLKLLEHAKDISDLERQVRFDLTVNGVLVCRYFADFVYQEKGAKIVEDVKGYSTSIYLIKRKLMKAVHGITVLET